MLRLTLDTCIIASAFRSRGGPSYALLDLLQDRRFLMPTSYAVFLEYESVLKRPAQRAVHGMSLETVDALLDDLSNQIEHVKISYRYRPMLHDPNDEFVLEAAVNGNADALVTYNIRDFLPGARRFGLRLVTPAVIISEGGLRS